MTAELLHATIHDLLAEGNWFLEPHAGLRVEHHTERAERWEVFRGQLLDSSQTRLEHVFESWQAWVRFAGEQDEQPLVGVKHDAAARRLHVVRFLRVRAWQPYQPRDGVIETREVEKWTRELVGNIDLAVHSAEEDLRGQLQAYLTQAIVGTSRLPITSLESPLPAFSLGRLAWLGGGRIGLAPVQDPKELLRRSFSSSLPADEQARALEFALRACAADDVAQLAGGLTLDRASLALVLRTLFNQLALSPYTSFVDHLTAFIGALTDRAAAVDAFSYFLRHLVRHLTAYDLVTFHGFGANYPDALALDAFLHAYVRLAGERPDLFGEGKPARHRRRALRQAVLVRRHYEGLPVPDQPTSQGENRRVLPEPFVAVPEEQILNPHRRSRRLFDRTPTAALLKGVAAEIFGQSLADLEHADELRELGMAVFLDRPLGVFKQAGEVDRTPIFSYEAFSCRRAENRLRDLVNLGFGEEAERARRALGRLAVEGVPASAYQLPPRAGVVALEDAAKASPDFLFLRGSRRGRNELLEAYDFSALRERRPAEAQWLEHHRNTLLIRPAAVEQRKFLVALDEHRRPRLVFCLPGEADEPVEYAESLGVEHPRQGLRVLVGGEDRSPIALPPRPRVLICD